ncbi:unnamed protein product [Brassicogethes aeneus]|uniref:Centriolar and ciliogenesis-associated protein HYLS1 C-terminal domain-containing protein n=1 Tax=Brassicogethes aeneus TaxID=1431903 RepID=A0A9P0B4P8_BRAAE|nr:unnamed protein product [Brassicogethes aeneus]
MPKIRHKPVAELPVTWRWSKVKHHCKLGSTFANTCVTVIKSTIARPNKSDPVALYHQYQNIWKRTSIPGVQSRTDLRWAVREKMLSGPKNLAHARFGRTDKSNVAQHILHDGHRIGFDNLKLIKEVREPSLPDSYESLYIYKSLNSDNGPVPNSSLYKLVC